MRRHLAALALAIATAWTTPTWAGDHAGSGLGVDALRGVGFDQRIGERLPLETPVRDERGAEVALGDYFGKRPVVLALVYNECPMLCSLVLNGLIGSLRAVKTDVGKDFDVLVVSFDPKDTPAVAKKKKDLYVKRYGRAGAERGFHFWTGQQAEIKRLTTAIGFNYEYDEKLRQFAHPSGIVIATPNGTIARYLFGAEYSPKDVGFALSDASNGKVGSIATQLLMLCYRYDPVKGTYAATAMTALRIGGALTLAAMLAFFVSSARKNSRVAEVTS